MTKAERNGLSGVGNGPNLASFQIPKTDDQDDISSDGDAIIFLKRGETGNLIPVTGQFDSAFSVVRIH
jgi:hypothetical protein